MGHTKSRKKSLIVVNKQGRKHITLCRSKELGYHQPSKTFTQIHHIICLTCMTNARISKSVKDEGKMEFIRECLKLTDWNINDAGDQNGDSNVVGLPLKRAFVTKPSADWDGWPCHQVEHNVYIKEVSVQLNKQVWTRVLRARKKCTECSTKCFINAKSIKTELSNQSQSLYEFLDDRGKDKGGTAVCWRDRETAKKKIWYFPFSMAETPKPRDPPKDWKDVRGSLRNYLSQIMFA